MDIETRSLTRGDINAARLLYEELTNGPKEVDAARVNAVLEHPGTSIIGAFRSEHLLSMATLHILPNATWSGRPYALVENVVTARSMRNQGIGRMVLDAVIEAAWAAECYKIMLLTSRQRGAKGFYTSVGFRDEGKHGMIIRRT